MNRLGRLSLPLRPQVCLLCQTQATMSSPLAGWQAVRSMATVRQRRQAARMVLSSNVDKSSLKQGRSKRDRAGPWSGMNQTEARLRDAPRSRSRAALKRSGDSEDDKQKPDSPLYKALKMQTALAPIPYGRRTAIKNKIAEVSSFDQFPLLPVVRHSISSQALPGLADIVPTPIQRLAIPQLLKDPIPKRTSKDVSDHEPNFEQYLLAAETGSGKTLAYLIPLIDSLKRMEVQDKEFEKWEAEQKAKEREEKLKNRAFDIEPEEAPLSDAGRPRVIILVPTSELVAQVGAKVKALSHTVKYRSGMISSNLTPRRIKSILFNPSGIDILVATPHLLASIAKTDPYVLSRVSHLVLDEADSLMDRSFLPTTTEIIEKSASSLHKLILCSATIPRSLDNLLRKRYPDIRRLTTPNLHAIPRRVQLGVVDIQRDPYRGNRSLACADVIWSIGKAGDTEPTHPFLAQAGPKVKKILVFVNEREEADEVAQFLRSKGIDAQSFSRDSSSRKQEELLEEFTESPIPPTAEEIMLAKNKRRQDNSIPFVFPEQQNKPGAERGLPNTKVLVTTDIASRGIDTIAVKTVILYHVPHNTIDFIHRLGRLGRMGKRGRAVVLVGKKDRKDVVKEVREGMFRGQALI
ncbi:P-loop containing nucleoside triphosphate hydrolase protein [Aspergillus welwitschiae]|uniref:RNA helicase n=1 Tax=Aspergillus welwitschiae TaxID=1341132 RepID=A0A3F3Q924_9EURO|nr:P-loop containing nucleoside triphosphate hydrolase protein [Aspergillus welwitschiae]RDH35557.1 P-loop containing nucleoside triphosphate hydrolase protein [Aspergillus welwitschiae]